MVAIGGVTSFRQRAAVYIWRWPTWETSIRRRELCQSVHTFSCSTVCKLHSSKGEL